MSDLNDNAPLGWGRYDCVACARPLDGEVCPCEGGRVRQHLCVYGGDYYYTLRGVVMVYPPKPGEWR